MRLFSLEQIWHSRRKAFYEFFNQHIYNMYTLQYTQTQQCCNSSLNMFLKELVSTFKTDLLTRILASMTAASKHTDSTKNVLKPFCVERCSMIIARRDLTELVASYTCQSSAHYQSLYKTPQHRTTVNHSHILALTIYHLRQQWNK